MSFFSFARRRTSPVAGRVSAPVARERLQMLLEYERRIISQSDFIAVLRQVVGRTVADVERELILETLRHCGGNRTHAANILGISIRRLRKKLHGYAKNDVEITPASHGLGESCKLDAAH
jgi:DNA-binding NtrC family response regulator